MLAIASVTISSVLSFTVCPRFRCLGQHPRQALRTTIRSKPILAHESHFMQPLKCRTVFTQGQVRPLSARGGSNARVPTTLSTLYKKEGILAVGGDDRSRTCTDTVLSRVPLPNWATSPWWPWWDSNPHPLRDDVLKVAWLPITPQGHIV